MHHRIEDAKAIFDAGVRAVQADNLLRGLEWDRIAPRPLPSYRHVFVVGMGKASLAMASVVEDRVEKSTSSGCVVVPEGYASSLPGIFAMPGYVQILEAGHPVPDEESRRAAALILGVARRAGEDDLVLVLISGGGSSLCADFLGDISLADARSTYHLLLESGADIHAVNTIRKHLSKVGGGRLARAAQPADVVSLIVSDVVGDDLSVVASGPTTSDPTTYDDAKTILVERGLWEKIPQSVGAVVEKGLHDSSLETPKPGSPVFDRTVNHLVGSNAVALKAAHAAARARGYDAEVVSTALTGEASEVGSTLAEAATARDYARPACLLYGGETTVTIRGTGRGGRNQEMALSAAVTLAGAEQHVVILCGGTDGVDGPTDAAGAVVTSETVDAAQNRGMDARLYLKNNDSYSFFSIVGGLLRSGHTHTNVMDLTVVLAGEQTGDRI